MRFQTYSWIMGYSTATHILTASWPPCLVAGASNPHLHASMPKPAKLTEAQLLGTGVTKEGRPGKQRTNSPSAELGSGRCIRQAVRGGINYPTLIGYKRWSQECSSGNGRDTVRLCQLVRGCDENLGTVTRLRYYMRLRRSCLSSQWRNHPVMDRGLGQAPQGPEEGLTSWKQPTEHHVKGDTLEERLAPGASPRRLHMAWCTYPTKGTYLHMNKKKNNNYVIFLHFISSAQPEF